MVHGLWMDLVTFLSPKCSMGTNVIWFCVMQEQNNALALNTNYGYTITFEENQGDLNLQNSRTNSNKESIKHPHPPPQPKCGNQKCSYA